MRTHGITYKLVRKQTASVLRTYSDSDYANDPDKKSRTGIIQTMYDAPVSWSSSRQTTVATSTYEAEYLAASRATQQTPWLRRLLANIQHPETRPTPVMIDNQAAISVAKNTAPTKRRKFIDIKHHHIQDHIKKGNITVHHIPTAENIADLFTKITGSQRHNHLTNKIHLTPAQSPSVNSGTV